MVIRDIIEIQIVTIKKKKWSKPTIEYFSNSYNVERRIECLTRRIEKLRANYMRDPDDSADALDVLIVYKAELTRLEAKYNYLLKIPANECQQAFENSAIH